MIAYCDWLYYANGYEKDSKSTRLATWKQIEKSGITPQGLKDKPNYPDQLEYIFPLHVEISRGLEKITYSDVKNYMEVTGDTLSRWEIDIIFKIDGIRLKHGY